MCARSGHGLQGFGVAEGRGFGVLVLAALAALWSVSTGAVAS
jgi:hypothetical protein